MERDMLIGALATGLVDATLEGYYAYKDASGDTSLRSQFPYIKIHDWLPPVDDWLAWVGTPVALYALGKYMRKPKLIRMAKGGAIYGVSAAIGQTTVNVSKAMQGQSTSYIVLR